MFGEVHTTTHIIIAAARSHMLCMLCVRAALRREFLLLIAESVRFHSVAVRTHFPCIVIRAVAHAFLSVHDIARRRPLCWNTTNMRFSSLGYCVLTVSRVVSCSPSRESRARVPNRLCALFGRAEKDAHRGLMTSVCEAGALLCEQIAVDLKRQRSVNTKSAVESRGDASVIILITPRSTHTAQDDTRIWDFPMIFVRIAPVLVCHTQMLESIYTFRICCWMVALEVAMTRTRTQTSTRNKSTCLECQWIFV